MLLDGSRVIRGAFFVERADGPAPVKTGAEAPDTGTDTGVCDCDKTNKCDKACPCDPDCADAATPDSGIPDGGGDSGAVPDVGEETDDKNKTPIGCVCSSIGL